MDDAPEIAPVRYQINRERRCERDTLSDQLTALKSLLRLDADGIGDREDLLDVLEKARQTIERFSITLRRESLNLDSSDADVTPPNTDSFNFETPESPFDSPCPVLGEDEGSVEGSIRLRSLSGSSSTHSSWRSSSSTISTSATSISPRDSHFSRRFASSPVYVSPIPYLGRLREEEFGFGDEMDASIEAEEEEEASDASFERLSSILASLQRQAEAAVLSPTVEEEEDSVVLDPASCWGSGDDLSPSSTRTITCRRAPRSASSTPSTPGLTPTLASQRCSTSAVPEPPLSAKPGVPEQQQQQMLPPFPLIFPESGGSCPPTPGLSRRRTGRPTSEGEGGGTKWEDLEGLLAEFFDERVFGRNGDQQDMISRWVWVYILSGGLVWTVVGWLLGWGCSSCEMAACVR